MEEKILLTERDVEQLYQIPRKTLQDRRFRGLPPAYVKVGARVYYRHEDLDAMLEANLHKSTSDRAA